MNAGLFKIFHKERFDEMSRLPCLFGVTDLGIGARARILVLPHARVGPTSQLYSVGQCKARAMVGFRAELAEV